MKKKVLTIAMALMMAFAGCGAIAAPCFASGLGKPSENAKNALEGMGSDGTVCDADDPDCDNVGDEFMSDLRNILTFIFSLMGIVAVIVIILGGFHFLTSTGDPGKIKKGKDTIIWGIIGLLVVLFSYAIVNFILVKIGG
jgi:hypothetical protein